MLIAISILKVDSFGRGCDWEIFNDAKRLSLHSNVERWNNQMFTLLISDTMRHMGGCDFMLLGGFTMAFLVIKENISGKGF